MRSRGCHRPGQIREILRGTWSALSAQDPAEKEKKEKPPRRYKKGSLREGHQKMIDTKLFEFSETSAFGEFTIDATVQDPEVTFRLISDDGFVVHKFKLTRSQLTPRGK